MWRTAELFTGTADKFSCPCSLGGHGFWDIFLPVFLSVTVYWLDELLIPVCYHIRKIASLNVGVNELKDLECWRCVIVCRRICNMNDFIGCIIVLPMVVDLPLLIQ